MHYAIGVDIGGTKIAAGIINEKGNLIQKEQLKSIPEDREKMFLQVVKCIRLLLDHCSIPLSQIAGIGIGVPGKVDQKRGIAVFQNNLPWKNFPIVERLRGVFPVKNIFLDNDVYMAAFAEYRYAKVTAEELFSYITISTGIACSMLQNNQFIRGAGFAGEIGLLPVITNQIDKKVERLEKVASGSALQHFSRQKLFDETVVTSELFGRYQQNDFFAQQVIKDAAKSIAHGIYAIVSLVDPHKIVFGGSVMIHNPFFLELVREELDTFLIEEQKHILSALSISELGNNQGVIGAGMRVIAKN